MESDTALDGAVLCSLTLWPNHFPQRASISFMLPKAMWEMSYDPDGIVQLEARRAVRQLLCALWGPEYELLYLDPYRGSVFTTIESGEDRFYRSMKIVTDFLTCGKKAGADLEKMIEREIRLARANYVVTEEEWDTMRKQGRKLHEQFVE